MKFAKTMEFIRKHLHNYLRIVFIGNVALLSVVATFSYFLPNKFEGTEKVNLFAIMAGSYWYAILILSAFGIYNPVYMEPIVYLQLIYKFLYSIYYLIGFNQYKIEPYGYICFFFIFWIFIICIYVLLKLIIFYDDFKKKKQLNSVN